ncbi:hypothetical protein FRC17_001553 [Serendipita sp. 399]|nr:hypothetical protein FRC17_001553 [Serendipita sp. 399]
MSCPDVHVRWWHSSHGAAHLELLATPAAKVSSQSWIKLTRDESNRCEAAWKSISDEERETPISLDDERDEDALQVGVSIGKERLFEIDVRSMVRHVDVSRVLEAFWTAYQRAPGDMDVRPRAYCPLPPHHHGPFVYSSKNRPVDEPLASELEKAYQTIKPWEPSYEEEVAAAIQAGSVAYEKLKVPLAHPSDGGSVFFDDAGSARILYSSLSTRVSSAIFATIRGSRSSSPYPGAPVAYRGYDEAVLRANVPSRPSSVSPTRAPGNALDDKRSRRKSMDARSVAKAEDKRGRRSTDQPRETLNDIDTTAGYDSKVGEGNSQDVTDLILVVHGIGQGLSTQYESYNFVYMVNLMRIIARKQAMSPALNSIMRSNNVQFLPIQWRTTLKLDEDESRRRAEDGLDNRFSLADITLKKHIPMIRELSNEVLIDIPYFMSHHQAKMIETVCSQANRTYRLWCARNPSFSTTGRVHIVAHSLGAPLCAHILSSQPTLQPPLVEPPPDIPWNQFLFNVSSLFMIGSPLAVFLHINQVQLIARKGRERTMQSPPDEALDRVGLLGCMAVDSVYNIFQLSDPIAYKLNPCVDSGRAAELHPIAIPSITGTLLGSFQKGVSRIIDGFFSASSTTQSGAVTPKESEEIIFELGGGPDKLQGSRAERRFAALNHHGAIDFYLPGEGGISEYVDMITAHSSYWGDSSLAAFILAEIFARKEDLVRTGLGPQLTAEV